MDGESRSSLISRVIVPGEELRRWPKATEIGRTLRADDGTYFFPFDIQGWNGLSLLAHLADCQIRPVFYSFAVCLFSRSQRSKGKLKRIADILFSNLQLSSMSSFYIMNESFNRVGKPV